MSLFNQLINVYPLVVSPVREFDNLVYYLCMYMFISSHLFCLVLANWCSILDFLSINYFELWTLYNDQDLDTGKMVKHQQNCNRNIPLVLTPENHHKSHTKSLQLLHWCKIVNFGKVCVFHIKSLKTGKIFYF